MQLSGVEWRLFAAQAHRCERKRSVPRLLILMVVLVFGGVVVVWLLWEVEEVVGIQALAWLAACDARNAGLETSVGAWTDKPTACNPASEKLT